MRELTITPIGRVVGGRRDARDDGWASVEAVIELDTRFGDDALLGLEEFSHIDVVFVFHLVDEADVVVGSRHPRGNADWPRVGIFAQRAKSRPNRLGVSCCGLLGVDGRSLRIRGLDAVEGTPVVDLKPHFREMGPGEPVREPGWAQELMQRYW